MQIQTKYKSVFKKYRKFEIEKHNNISVEIQRSDRADHVDVCPDFDFFLQRLGLFMHTFDDHHYHCSPNWPHSSLGWDTEREPCVLTKEDMSWTFTILAIMVLDVNFNNPYKHLSSIVPPKTRILGPQKGDLLAPRIRTCVTNPSTSDRLLTLSDPCMLYILRKLSSASTSLSKD